MSAANGMGAVTPPTAPSGVSAAGVAGRVLRGLAWAGQRLWLLAALLVLWEVLARQAGSLFIPPFSTIVTAFADTWLSDRPVALFLSDQFRADVLPSLARLGAGYGMATVIGVCGGIVLGVWRQAGAFFNPLIRLGMAVPVTMLLPVAIVIFGITSGMNIFLIALGCLWPILVNTYDGIRGLDTTMTTAARSLRLSPRRHFLSVLLPGASPSIVAGMRISVGIGLVLMVISELFAATAGLGFFIVNQQKLFRFPELWSAILLVALLGILLNGIFELAERSVLRWHRAAKAGAGDRR
ncbi:ABC transporter permease subunit [Microtetraspora sp. AC03309]|uniref:ABC transporter permease n=1 Tax=Microtetraspora sp. AC03309 TaxID=2779376 RepID=UPI001E38EA0C|nr:ABC transporter permease subunit [Microtetraspora sp. AC03309]MCC5578791.1 ABC transporter permease subunit [Microtetraspora sp. AC03309]